MFEIKRGYQINSFVSNHKFKPFWDILFPQLGLHPHHDQGNQSKKIKIDNGVSQKLNLTSIGHETQ